MLDITALRVRVGDTEIIKGLTLRVNAGEVHAVMGPNGAGKSTLAAALAGRNGYEITGGSVAWQGRDLLAMEPHDRAACGLFLSFQYPVEIVGVSTLNFLRTALNSQRKTRGEPPISAADFLRLARQQADALGINMDMLKRAVNVGFSGGEKKRNEMLQMAVLDPRLAILDETDSGLDIDALRTVAAAINGRRGADKAILLITHYQRLLDHVQPDYVHVLQEGRIVRSGGPALAQLLEQQGYTAIREDNDDAA